METKTDSSYGVVPVFKGPNSWQVLLIHQISYRGDDFWIFPKGHKEGNERPLEAAGRELREETGLDDVVLSEADAFSVFYSFVHEGVTIEKAVTYYLGYCQNQAVVISQPNEVKELRWCTFLEADYLLTHQNSKAVLKEVAQLLDNWT